MSRFCLPCAEHQGAYGVPPLKCDNRHCANRGGKVAKRVVRGVPGGRRQGRKLKGIAGS